MRIYSHKGTVSGPVQPFEDRGIYCANAVEMRTLECVLAFASSRGAKALHDCHQRGRSADFERMDSDDFSQMSHINDGLDIRRGTLQKETGVDVPLRHCNGEISHQAKP